MVENNAPPKSVREPQALSGEYHKARKQLMLWAGTLFVWELIGIDLEKAKEAGGNAGAIITAIKSPQAIPWVLLILVAYFLFKTTVEWHQCSRTRRQLRVSRVDFISAWVVSLGAYVLYLFQAVKKVQVADVVQGSPGSIRSIITIVFSSFFMMVYLIRMVEFRLMARKDFPLSLWDWKLLFPILLLLPMVFLLWLSFRLLGIPVQWSTKGALVGVGLAIFVWSGIKWLPVGFSAANSAVRRWARFSATKTNESP